MAYDKKFKERALAYREQGNSIRKTAKTFGISTKTLDIWQKEYNEHGRFINKHKPANNTKLTEEALMEYFEENPDSYQEETAAHFGVSQSGVCRALKRLKSHVKKIKRYREQDPVKVAEYQKAVENIESESIVYIDEMGIDTFIYREYAYSKRGVNVIGRISGKKYKRTSIVAAKLGKDIVAPLQYEGSMDSRLFEHWFEFCLIPLLPTNSTAVLDNATFHNKKRLVALAQKHGCSILFLPPYSPELNEIEKFWGLA